MQIDALTKQGIAYFGMQDRRYGLGDEWLPYLEYEPVGAELREYVEWLAGCVRRGWNGLRWEVPCRDCSVDPDLQDQKIELPRMQGEFHHRSKC